MSIPPEGENWLEMVRAAHELPTKELRQHARVSTENNHRCRSCFTCACALVLRELQKPSPRQTMSK